MEMRGGGGDEGGGEGVGGERGVIGCIRYMC